MSAVAPRVQVGCRELASGADGSRTTASRMRRRSFRAIVGVLLLVSPCVRSADAPLSFGIFPYLSPQLLVTQFKPLANHLQQAAGRPLSIETAPNYIAFRDRTRAGDYDIIFTAPHFGRLAEMETQYQAIAVTRYRVSGVVCVGKDSSIRQLSELRGKTIAMPPRVSMVHALTLDLFRLKGLVPGRDITLREFDTNLNSMTAPLRGDSDAGVTGPLVLSTSSQRDQLRVIAETADVPGFYILAHPRLSAAVIDRLRKAAYAFGDTPAGQVYFAATGHVAWLPVDDATRLALDPYVRHAKE
jgi:phosphonate transport system substrate-binding protein